MYLMPVALHRLVAYVYDYSRGFVVYKHISLEIASISILVLAYHERAYGPRRLRL